MTLQKDLAEVAGMAEKATPGPWVANDGELATDLYWANGNMVADALSEFADGPSDPPNASFVAAAVNFIRTHHATITDMAKRLEAAERDAARYRWILEHFRFANDSLREIWFDAHTRVNQEDAKDLDKEIDAAMQESGDRRTPEQPE